MCGIFGLISTTAVSQQRFIELAEHNRQRGNLGFGYTVGTAVDRTFTLHTSRHPGPFDPATVAFSSARLALGHIRAPTAGQTTDLAAIHPFAAGDGLLAHNGLLLNHTAFPHWQLPAAQPIDSHVILGGIQAHLDAGLAAPDAIRATVSRLDGQQACWYWHNPGQKLYLWRVMAPIFIQPTAVDFTFSSLRAPGLSDLLPEGVVFELDPFTLRFVDITDFSYYSPYGKQ